MDEWRVEEWREGGREGRYKRSDAKGMMLGPLESRRESRGKDDYRRDDEGW